MCIVLPVTRAQLIVVNTQQNVLDGASRVTRSKRGK